MCILGWAGVLGMLHLHEEEFQVLAGYVLIGREEVKPIIWPPGYMTISRVAKVGVIRLTCFGKCRPRARTKEPYSCWFQDEIFRVWTHFNLSLVPDGLSQFLGLHPRSLRG